MVWLDPGRFKLGNETVAFVTNSNTITILFLKAEKEFDPELSPEALKFDQQLSHEIQAIDFNAI